MDREILPEAARPHVVLSILDSLEHPLGWFQMVIHVLSAVESDWMGALHCFQT